MPATIAKRQRKKVFFLQKRKTKFHLKKLLYLIDRFEEDHHLMPPITQFASELTREKEWDNIAAIHSGLVMATTWSFNKCKMGELKLVPEQFENKTRTDLNSEATCLCVTHCGNFVIIGNDFDSFFLNLLK